MSPQLTNPFDDYYEQLKKKIVLHMKNDLFNEQLIARMKEAYLQRLQQEQIVFTRNEKKRLYRDVLGEIFDDILSDI